MGKNFVADCRVMGRGREKQADTALPRATRFRPRRYVGRVIPHPNRPEEEPAPLGDYRVGPLEDEGDLEEAADLREGRGEIRGGPADGLCIDADPRRPATVLSSDDMLFIWRLHQKKLSVRAIARLLSTKSKEVSPATINRFIRRVSDRPEEVQHLLKSLRGEAVDAWRVSLMAAAEKGQHLPAKDLLTATGTIRHDQPIDKVIIIVGDGRQAVAQLPSAPSVLPGEVIDVKSEPVKE
jgi:hypothetical protein